MGPYDLSSTEGAPRVVVPSVFLFRGQAPDALRPEPPNRRMLTDMVSNFRTVTWLAVLCGCTGSMVDGDTTMPPAPDGSSAQACDASANMGDSRVTNPGSDASVSAPDATILKPGDPGCGLESAAFCETFDAPSPGGGGGDIDESRWAVSRWGNLAGRMGHRGNFVRLAADSVSGYRDKASLCGGDFSDVQVGEDFRVCNGQLEEVIRDDGNAFTINSFMARQLFDFADRTGTLVFDVDAKIEHGHGWWTEFWISQEPQPVPYQGASTVESFPKNALGIMMHGGENGGCTSINAVFRTTGYDFRTWTDKFWEPESTQVLELECVETEDTVLNHFEVKVSKDRLEVLGSNAGDPSSLRRIGVVSDLGLNFERGYVSFQHAHYNAAKADGDAGNTPVQTYRWDNIGFDGPVHAPLRAYDAPMSTTPESLDDDTAVHYGHSLPATLEFTDVTVGSAKLALLNLSTSMDDDIEYRINGGGWHSHEGVINTGSLSGWSIPLELAELQNGTNTIEIRSDGADKVGNVDLTLID